MKWSSTAIASVLLMVLQFSGTAQVSVPSKDSGMVQIELSSHFGLVLVKAEVDGTPVTLILDTGSSHTIFSTRLAHVHPSTFETRAAPAKGSGWVGTAVKVKATLKIG